MTRTGVAATSETDRQLREAGSVAAEPAGRYTYYRLVPEALDNLGAWLTEMAGAARTAQQVRPTYR